MKTQIDENKKVTIFKCSRGGSSEPEFIPIRLKVEPELFEKFKDKIKLNPRKNHNIHNLFHEFMKGYVNA